jgi:integrase
MPKITAHLSEAAVRRLKDKGRHPVGGVAGLRLQVTDRGARSWILRATVSNKVRDIGLGTYPTVPLKAARESAPDIRLQIQRGIDPLTERQRRGDELAATRASRKTFNECTRAYIASVEKQWRNPKSAAQWESSLDSYANPSIGKLAVSDITTAHILDVLSPIWSTKTETASRVRGRIESVLAYATTRGFRKGDNPARWKGHLDTLLPSPASLKSNKHHAALGYTDIGGFMRDLRSAGGIASKALEYSILTAARSGEARGATWVEIDLNAKQWTIPAARMKAKKEHVIPLSGQAVTLLTELQKTSQGDYVFPGQRGSMLSDMTMGKVVKRLHSKAIERGERGYVDAHMDDRVVTPHGFRSTFRDWAAEVSTHPRDVIEHALAHQLKDKAEAAYQRRTSIPKRIILMQEWADYCDVMRATGSGMVTNISGTHKTS